VIEELKEKYPDPSVSEYLEEVRTTFWTIWIRSKSARRIGRSTGIAEGPSMKPPGPERDPFRLYGVNVIWRMAMKRNRR